MRGPKLLVGAGRAAYELLLARVRLALTTPGKLMTKVHFDAEPGSQASVFLPSEIECIAYLLPRVAARLPWRTDCLVQALAARRWLGSLGHGAEIFLGVRKGNGRLEAHAWCKWQGHVVSGGSIDPYATLAHGRRRTS